jgi:cytochrome c556
MRHLMAAIVTILLGSCLLVADKPHPLFTSDDFVASMKALGRNFTRVNSLIAAGDYDSAKQQLARSREVLATTISYWRSPERNDAIEMLRDGLAKMDALDAVLSLEKVDPASATDAARHVASACQSCHTAYREQNARTGTYTFKKGSGQ